MRTLVDRLTPVVQARVTRGLLRRGPGRGGRDLRQEVEDFTQDVFLALFRDGGRALRAWDPQRGLSLENFVGLLAQHQVASILRSGKTSGWIDLPTETETLEREATAGPGPDQQAATREMCQSLLSRLVAKLSPQGLDLFWRLVVREEPIDTVSANTGMTADALYTWRSRLARLARSLATEPTDEDAAPQVPRRSGGIRQ
jgi:RNA polymerase sigma-70 factor (ECF subfamily)